jgi:preprotein translocase subunit SecA
VIAAHRTRRAIGLRHVSTGTPYIEKTDHQENVLDRTLLHAWGRVSPHLFSKQAIRQLNLLAQRTEREEARLTGLSDEGLLRSAEGLRRRLSSSGLNLGDTAVAFALAREAAYRHTGMRHFQVQLLGGAAMMRGALAEMQTGEGKSLTALLPAVAAALTGSAVHIITVNDYLARRDADQFRSTYKTLGLTVGVVEHGQRAEERQRAYASDVTYCTNKELVFDYLRDRLALGARRGRARLIVDELFKTRSADRPRGLLLRGLHFAIVDEADSVLIDEARTPLILSGIDEDAEDDAGLYETALDFARQLVRGEDFHLLANEKAIRLTAYGERRIAELATGLEGLWAIRRAREELVQQALSALYFFKRDVQYIIAYGKVQIVDEYTGRVMPDRSWERGLHQLIEAKENCAVTKRHQTLARITYQRFFRRYIHLCGMTGTAIEAAGELRAVYGLRVVPIATNRPLRRMDLGTRVLPTAELKWNAVLEVVKAATRKNRAVLIGTRSVDASEHVGELLLKSGLQPVILNARQDRQEAEIVAGAGQPGRVTVATNMAGRGTDIQLDPVVRDAGGLHVILTEYHESRRIDRQLFGRAGRQGDPGSYESIVALDDELFQRFAGKRLLSIVTSAARYTQKVSPIIGRTLRGSSQSAAERVHARARRRTLAEDDRLSKSLGFAGTE